MARYKDSPKNIRYWKSKGLDMWFIGIRDGEVLESMRFAWDASLDSALEEITNEYGNIRRIKLEKTIFSLD